jgi:hypothetical protein
MRDYLRRYRVGRSFGERRPAALISALPIRLYALYALARGRTVVYRATIEDGCLVFGKGTRGAIVAESTFIGPLTMDLILASEAEAWPNP